MPQQQRFNQNDIHRHLSNYRRKNAKTYPAYIAKKILNKYFELVIEQVLQGYEWEFPNGFGKLYIEWEKENPALSKAYYLKDKRINLSRIGKYYKIVLESEFLEKQGVKFQAWGPLRKALQHYLITTNIEYRAA